MSLMRRRALPLDDQILLDGLLEDAFALGRARTTGISAARVRARVAWERDVPVSRGWRAVSVLGRLGETSLGLGLTALLLVGSLGSVDVQPETSGPKREGGFMVRISAPLDDSRFLRLLRLGFSTPLVDDVDPATALKPQVLNDDQRQVPRELQGLLR